MRRTAWPGELGSIGTWLVIRRVPIPRLDVVRRETVAKAMIGYLAQRARGPVGAGRGRIPRPTKTTRARYKRGISNRLFARSCLKSSSGSRLGSGAHARAPPLPRLVYVPCEENTIGFCFSCDRGSCRRCLIPFPRRSSRSALWAAARHSSAPAVARVFGRLLRTRWSPYQGEYELIQLDGPI
jgi:hypothetical protein